MPSLPPAPDDGVDRDGADRYVRRLNRRYLAGLLAAAGLLLADQLLLWPPLSQLERDAPAVNVAGRQRMLSQRLAKAALAASAGETPAARDAAREEAREVYGVWADSHRALRSGVLASTRDDEPLRREFSDVDPVFERMRRAAARFIDAPAPAAARDDLAAILSAEPEYLRRMDRIVGLYESAARDRAARLRRISWAVTGVIVLTLAAVGRFALAPASRLIGRQVAALREARDRLEDRVRERTAALEAAGRALESEHRERLAAERRHRELLEQFGHAARVNTMGEMASGLAHELNQPLGAIANYLGGCLERLDAAPAEVRALREPLESALAVTLRAGETVRRIRRFASRQEFREEDVDPSALVREAVALLRDAARRRGVSVRVETASDLPPLTGDAVQLQQVLVNLIRNALDSAEAARAAGVANPMAQTVIVSVGRSSDGGVSFSVIDHGEGIPPDRIGKIFDPFFSTRAEGMGMGLAISRGIVEAHRGRIEADSEPGVRTRVGFRLPARDRPRGAGP